tara:strand:+ start:694 stop:1572 length:879 start_codon:yes stop_codon:yes gene_type:complete
MPSSEKNFISVGIPTYNSSNYLNECIKSVISKKRINQIIISDDKSKENEIEKIEEIIKKFKDNSNKDIRLIKNNANLGAFANKLKLIKESTNNFVYILDSDNIAGKNLDLIISKIFKTNNNSNYLFQPNIMYQFSQYPNIAKFISNFQKKYSVKFLPNDTSLDIKDIKDSLILNPGSYELKNFVESVDDLNSNRAEDFLIDKWIFWILNCGNFIVDKYRMIEIAEEGLNLDRKLLSIDAVVFSYLWLNSGSKIKILDNFFHHHRKRKDSVSFIEREDSLYATKYFIKTILKV